MNVTQEVLTPTRAHELLDAAARAGQPQRWLSQHRVAAMARAMESGKWRVTHQPIALDTAGVLIDGQHRVAAVAASGIAQTMLIAYDVAPDTFDVIDTGKARTAADTLHIAGYASANQVAAAARMLLAYDKVKGTTATLGSVTRDFDSVDVHRLVDSERGDLILAAVPQASRIAAAWGRYGTRSWLGAACTLLAESPVHPDIAREYLDKLAHGDQLAPSSPILALRRWAMSDTGLARQQTGQRAHLGIAVFVKTLNAWLARERRSLVGFRFGGEAMPVITLPDGFTTAVYGDDERSNYEVEQTAAQEAEEAAARDALV